MVVSQANVKASGQIMVEPMFSKVFESPVAIGQIIELSGAEAKHAISVRRMRVGEAIQLSNGDGLRVRGEVNAISGNLIKIQVIDSKQEELPNIQLTLIQALAKGDRDELAIQAATELGAVGIIPWEAERSISKWIGLKEVRAVERWQVIVSEAAKQALRSFVPRVSNVCHTAELISKFSQFDQVLVLDPKANHGFGSLNFPETKKIALIVGPEGGISDSELDDFQSAGALRIHLGTSILRTSTAGIAAMSGIYAKSESWS